MSSIERWLKQKGLAGKKETKLIARARSSLGLSAGNEEDTKESCVICHGRILVKSRDRCWYSIQC